MAYAIALGAIAAGGVGYRWFFEAAPPEDVQDAAAPTRKGSSNERGASQQKEEDASLTSEDLSVWEDSVSFFDTLSTEDIQAMDERLNKPVFPLFNGGGVGSISFQTPAAAAAAATAAVAFAWAVFLLSTALVYQQLNSGWTFSESLYYAASVGYLVGFGGLAQPESAASLLFSVLVMLLGFCALGAALGLFLLTALETNISSGGRRGGGGGGGGAHAWATDLPNQSTMRRFRAPTFALLVCLLGVGVAFGVVWEEWSWERSLYFSVSALTTAGLQAPEHANKSDDSDDAGSLSTFSALFVFSYVSVGVPACLCALAQGAWWVAEQSQRRASCRALGTDNIARGGCSDVGGNDNAGGGGGGGGGGDGVGDGDAPSKNNNNKRPFLFPPRPRHVSKRHAKRLVTREEFDSVRQILRQVDTARDAETVNFGEFLALELLRLGRTTTEEVSGIVQEFVTLDVDRSGDLTWAEIRLFQKTQAARCLETEHLMRADKSLPRQDAQRIADSTPVRELCVVKEQLKLREEAAAGAAAEEEAAAAAAAASKSKATELPLWRRILTRAVDYDEEKETKDDGAETPSSILSGGSRDNSREPTPSSLELGASGALVAPSPSLLLSFDTKDTGGSGMGPEQRASFSSAPSFGNYSVRLLLNKNRRSQFASTLTPSATPSATTPTTATASTASTATTPEHVPTTTGTESAHKNRARVASLPTPPQKQKPKQKGWKVVRERLATKVKSNGNNNSNGDLSSSNGSSPASSPASSANRKRGSMVETVLQARRRRRNSFGESFSFGSFDHGVGSKAAARELRRERSASLFEADLPVSPGSVRHQTNDDRRTPKSQKQREEDLKFAHEVSRTLNDSFDGKQGHGLRADTHIDSGTDV